MPHWRLFYLVVWSMRGRAPKIDANVEDLLLKAIRSQCAGLGIPVHAIGARQLPEVVAYVTDQRTRHAAQKVWHKMEPGAPRDEPA